MPNLTLTPRGTATKPKRGRRKGARSRRRRGDLLTAIKVAFVLERWRHRRRQRSSPSPREIALVVVSLGLAILVIRVAAQRARSRGAGTPAETAEAESAQAQTPEAEPQGEAASSSPTPGNDGVPASDSTLTDTVQSEMSRLEDTPAPATETD